MSNMRRTWQYHWRHAITGKLGGGVFTAPWPVPRSDMLELLNKWNAQQPRHDAFTYWLEPTSITLDADAARAA